MVLIEKLLVVALISVTAANAYSTGYHEEEEDSGVERSGHGDHGHGGGGGGHGHGGGGGGGHGHGGGGGGGHGHGGHGGGGHGGHAHSFHHFSGPVVGEHVEVSWKDKHGHHDHDYKAYPKYKYAYGVEDSHTKDYHGQKEHRDGKEVEGEYHLHEPGGNVRSVKYHSHPHGGFFAEVHNYGGNDHSGGGHGHKHR
ncbi:cuticular protein 11 [Megachile rotundata]|uniref:cuticular protein 11 n=1 Tax=Megachile rotundata TaxID=143995 RepID=UPI003FD69D3F